VSDRVVLTRLKGVGAPLSTTERRREKFPSMRAESASMRGIRLSVNTRVCVDEPRRFTASSKSYSQQQFAP
jgi:hypothetical protein